MSNPQVGVSFVGSRGGVVEGVCFVELLVLAQDLNEMSVCRDDLCEFKRCCVCLRGIGSRLSRKWVLQSELWMN